MTDVENRSDKSDISDLLPAQTCRRIHNLEVTMQ